MSNDYEDLKRRVEKLEGELGEAKKALEAVKPPVEPFVPKKPWQKIDYTEGMSMPPSAMKPMVDLIGDMKDRSKLSDVRRPSYSEPGGFGPPPKPSPVPEVKRGSGWDNPVPLEGMIKGRWSPNDREDRSPPVERSDLGQTRAGVSGRAGAAG